MKDHRKATSEGKLPLPQPRSPRELDDKILDYARANTPPKRPFFSPVRTTGLATAAIVGLAVLISEPERPAPSLDSAVPALQKSLSADMEQARVATEAVPGAAPVSKGRHSESSRSPTGDNSSGSGQQALLGEQHFDSFADSAAPVAELTEPTAPESQREQQRQAIRQQLDQLAILLNGGEEMRARARYRDLRHNCLDCQLPDTLEQALADWRIIPLP